MNNKVLRHPDKEEIIKMLLNGESVKEVERWIKKKHPRSRRLQISYMTLQKFRAENLNLKGDVLDDIKNRRAEVNKQDEALEKKMIIEASSAYQEKIDEIASAELDVTRRLLEMDKLVTSRIEFYYNLLQQGGSLKEDKIFLEYINTLKSLMQDWKKYIEGVADKKIEHNVNFNIINTQVSVLKNSVCEVLQELQPELIPVFLDRLDENVKRIDADLINYNEVIDV
jgi:cysteinyl-tRNA synthetase